MAKTKVKGLDSFEAKFLGVTPGKEASVAVQDGWKAPKEHLDKYAEQRKEEFINRAGAFTVDLLGFFKEQKVKRDLDDKECIFAVALATIQLRELYGSPQGVKEGQGFNAKKREELLALFDSVCECAQEYYDENKNDA